MPEADGFELCRKIEKDPDIDHVPVAFLAARADLEDKVEGLDVGADACPTKPFEPEALIARIENLIATRRTLRESFRDEGTEAPAAVDEAEGEDGGVENAEAALPPTAEAASLRDRVEAAIAEHLADPDFGVAELAMATALSASQLRRRMKEIYDRTPVQLLRRRRLEAGARLLQDREDVTIGKVAYAVGFNSQSHFSRSFREAFGTPPRSTRGRRSPRRGPPTPRRAATRAGRRRAVPVSSRRTGGGTRCCRRRPRCGACRRARRPRRTCSPRTEWAPSGRRRQRTSGSRKTYFW
jgi:AraC-like DNA-binding protein